MPESLGQLCVRLVLFVVCIEWSWLRSAPSPAVRLLISIFTQSFLTASAGSQNQFISFYCKPSPPFNVLQVSLLTMTNSWEPKVAREEPGSWKPKCSGVKQMLTQLTKRVNYHYQLLMCR